MPITANTVYVASYFAPAGGYSYNRAYFATTGVTAGSLYLLREGEQGANGAYGYGFSSSLPNLGYQSSNYWVDVTVDTSSGTNSPPVLTNPGAQSGTVGVAASQQRHRHPLTHRPRQCRQD